MFGRLFDSAWTYFIGAGLLLGVAVALQFEWSLPSRPVGAVSDLSELSLRGDLNVVFILVDSLRADRLSLYGYPRKTTPVLDELARHGVVFDQVISQSSWTKGSMASMWTATYPASNGVMRFNHAMAPEITMPAEIFKQAGYRTAGIFRNGWVAANFGFDQGFDVYYRPRSGAMETLRRHSPSPRPIGGTDEDVAMSARDFLENFGQDQFFLYLHLMDVHQYVFDESAKDFGPSYSDAYDKAVSWTDRLIGEIVRSIDETGVLSRTVVVIASDHGEAFREHRLEGHGRNLYREVIQVPFIIILPFILEQGIRVGTTVANVNVWPTILDLVGLPPIEGADGKSLAPLILAARSEESSGPAVNEFSEPVISHMDGRWGSVKGESANLVSLIDGDFQLIVHLDDRANDEFFDWNADPTQQKNLFAKSPAELRPMLERVDRYLADAKSPWGVEPPTIELEAMRLNQLKALGYRLEP